jgi:hypothetical protein
MIDVNQIDLNNDDELEILRQRMQQKMLAGQLQDSSNPYANLGLQMAGGLTDVLSRHAASGLTPTEIMTGIKIPSAGRTNASEAVQRALAARASATRQKALDDSSLFKTLEDMKTRRENATQMASYRKDQMEMNDSLRRATLGAQTAKSQQDFEQKQKDFDEKKRQFDELLGIKQGELDLKGKAIKQKGARGSGGSSVPGLIYSGGGSPTADDVKKVKSMHSAKLDLDASLDDLQRAINANGTKLIPGAGKVALENSYSDFVIKAKNAAELGALTGPDMGLISQMLQDPTSLYANTMMNENDYTKSIQWAKQRANASLSSKLSAYGFSLPGNKSSGGMVKMISPSGKPGNMPSENVEKALKRGFKRAE